MVTDKKKVALLVHCSDGYELLFKGFHYFFSKYWDYNIPCSYYFATEEKDINLPGFIHIKSGKGEWSNRLKALLTEKIKEEYILYFQEDMWLNKKVNAAFFKQLFELAAEKNWKQVKLHSCNVYKTIATPRYIEGFNITRLENNRSTFLMSHQVSLWHKEYLIQQLYENESPWMNERHGTQRLRLLNPGIMHLDYFAENGGAEINKNKSPVLRSEYQAVSFNSSLHHTVRPYIQELMNSGAGHKEYAKKLRRHYILQLTHDRSTKPRKERLWTAFRIWLSGLRPRLAYALFAKVK